MTSAPEADSVPAPPRRMLLLPGTVDDEDLELARDLARGAVSGLVRIVATPASRAGLVTAVGTAAVMARAGARPLLSVAVALLAGVTAEKLYEMAEDIRETSVLQRAYLNEQLRKQGQDWLDAHPDRAGQPAEGKHSQ
jgi:hypothetical protein